MVVRNTPLDYGERLNHDLGHLRPGLVDAQAADHQRRPALGEAERAGAGRRVAGRPLRAGRGTFEEIEDLPNWSDLAPRFAAVYDLFGNGKTALKYSLNRYNLARTTGIAANYNPLLAQTATLPWRDVNGDDIAQGERGCTRDYRGTRRLRDQLRGLSSNFGIAALNHLRRLSAHLEPRARPRAAARAAAAPVGDGQLVPRLLPQPDDQPQPELVAAADYTPVHASTTRSPASRSRSTAATQAAQWPADRNLDTFDPEREAGLRRVQRRVQGALGTRRARSSAASSFERQRDKICTAPDDPNYLIASATTRRTTSRSASSSRSPARTRWRTASPFSACFQSNQSPAAVGDTRRLRIAATRNMAITRHDALSGQLPGALPGRCDDPAGTVFSRRR